MKRTTIVLGLFAVLALSSCAVYDPYVSYDYPGYYYPGYGYYAPGYAYSAPVYGSAEVVIGGGHGGGHHR